MKDLKEIQDLLAPDLELYKKELENLLQSDIKLLQEISGHISLQRGKQLRPLLTITTAHAVAGDLIPHSVHIVAATMEALHNSSLLHDDVIDESHLRRGIDSVNHIYGNKTAVLAGDYFLAKVMLTLNELGINEVTHIAAQAAVAMTEGEMLQQQYCGHYDTTPIQYLQIIDKKTAQLIAACSRIGATIVSKDEKIRKAAEKYGRELGIAFQIRDDLRDFLPSEMTGKPQGNDLRERKATIPLLQALELADKKKRSTMLQLLGKDSLDESDIQQLSQFVLDSDAVAQCKKKINLQLREAKKALSCFPSNKYTDILQNIIEYLK